MIIRIIPELYSDESNKIVIQKNVFTMIDQRPGGYEKSLILQMLLSAKWEKITNVGILSFFSDFWE